MLTANKVVEQANHRHLLAPAWRIDNRHLAAPVNLKGSPYRDHYHDKGHHTDHHHG